MSELKTNSRASRSSESRLHEGRIAEIADRPILKFESSGFNVPEAVRESDPEHEYCYVAYHSGGVDLRQQYEDAVYHRGYQPVKRSAHPLLKKNIVDSPFARSEDDDLIKYGGQILMKRPIEVAEQEQSYFNERDVRQNYIRELHTNANPNAPRLIQDERRWGNRVI